MAHGCKVASQGCLWSGEARQGPEGFLERWTGPQERPGGRRGTKRGEMGAGPGREEGGAAPEAPPLGSEGQGSWFPAPAWEPETTEGAVIAPGVCRACGRWEKPLLNFPHAGPWAQAGPDQAAPMSPGGLSGNPSGAGP